MTGLNWLWESSLPGSIKISKSKTQGKGKDRDSYCVACIPGDVSTVGGPQIGQEPERRVGLASPTEGPSPLYTFCKNWNDLDSTCY